MKIGGGQVARVLVPWCSVLLLVLGYSGVSYWLLAEDLIEHQHHELERGREDEARHSPDYIRDHQNEQVLFFNRVPKCGSEMLVLLLQWLQGQNSFRHVRLKNPVRRFLTKEEQLQMAGEVGEKIQEAEGLRISLDRHVYFTNFSTLGLKMPLYLNLIRDPVEKLASRFYYARVTPRPGAMTPPGYLLPTRPRHPTLEECVLAGDSECTFISGQLYDLSIPYFCGHHSYCRELNNEGALRAAQRHVEEWYPVVGILEDLNATLSVLQHRLPHYFEGVQTLYYEELMAPHHNKNRGRPSASSWVEEELRRNLSLEYEFYHFVRQRLHLQYQEITNQNEEIT